jgi:hypothetical protein
MIWNVSGSRFEIRTSEYGGLLIIVLPDFRDHYFAKFRMRFSEDVGLHWI